MYYTVNIFFRNVHHLSDGRFAAGVWAKHASFNFDQYSTEYISPVDASEIIAWMSGPKIVAEFGPTNTEKNILETTALLKIKHIAIPEKLYSPQFDEIFEEIFFLEDNTKNLIPPGRDASFFHYPVLNKAGANVVLESKFTDICIEGIPEDKPGTADYEELSIFMEYLED
jgi:hypothetical protein